MSSDNTPPAQDGRDEARQRSPSPPPIPAVDADPSSGAPRPLQSSSPDQPALPGAGPRIAAGLPPQPEPSTASKGSLRSILPASGFASWNGGGLSLSAIARGQLTSGTVGNGAGSPGSPAVPANPGLPRSPAPKAGPPGGNLPRPNSIKPNAAAADRAKSTRNRTSSAAAPPLATSQAPPARASAGAGGSEPPEPKRITPRSPRAALQPDHVPLPTPKLQLSRRTRNPLVIVGNAVFSLLVLFMLLGGAAIVFGKTRFETPGPLMEDKVVSIPRSGMIEIADLLRREGVIDEHRLVFVGGVLALRARSELKAGEYLFPKRASVRDVVETIVEGKVVQHQLTIPEGLTSEQVVARLLESDVLSGNVKDVPREGSLLPDGYHFHRGFAREQLLQRMRQAQDRLVREVWDRRTPDLPVKTPEQLIILASIIEKETGKPEERTRVAAVFANRLKQKMKLQSDPTIVYGIAFGKGTLGRPISKADIVQPTPYNTYVIDGLPPSPIANPGRASIEAAANPARTKELFFVADGTGGHAFAETYDQHLKNVARLRGIEREQEQRINQEQRSSESPAETQAPAAAPTRPTTAPRGKRGPNGPARSAGAAQ